MNFTDGLRNGIYMDINDRNQIKEYGYFANDKKDGKWTKWNYSRRESQKEFKNGVPHGFHRTFHNTGKDGAIKDEWEFKDGKLDGVYRYYLEDGTVSLDYVYKNGEKVTGKLN